MKEKPLKTLKDLKTIKVDRFKSKYPGHEKWFLSDCVYKKELKAEAVKWVKAHLVKLPDGSFEYDGRIDLDAWIQFFNLTEEDLKDA